MKQKIKAKSNYKARGSSLDVFDLGDRFVLFLAEGICASIQKER